MKNSNKSESRNAVKSDWKTLDMPAQHDTFILDRVFTPEQMDISAKDLFQNQWMIIGSGT